jgi:hypothetical protein
MRFSDQIILLLLKKEHIKRKKSKVFVHSRNRKVFYNNLSYWDKSRRRNRIPRIALLPPSQSAWRKIFDSRSDQALITMTGFDFETFEWLNEKFRPYFEQYSPFIDESGRIKPLKCPKEGRKRIITSRDCLGLNLAWTRTRGSTFVLQTIFGMSETSVSMYLRFGRRILIRVLKNETDSAIRMPTDDEMVQYKRAVQERHPLLEGVWCSMDGLKLALECSSNDEEQNDYYNGWTCDHYVSALLVFCPDGTIPMCCYNVPGSQHDSAIARMGCLYEKLQVVYEESGGRCAVDSAFAKNDYNFLVKSGNKLLTDTRQEAMIKNEATSMRQSSEWGMRAFQSSFPRIKDRIRWEKNGERRLIMKLLILLYNTRSRKVGINQIRNVYMPSLIRDANENQHL